METETKIEIPTQNEPNQSNKATPENSSISNKLSIPMAIIVAGALVAGAVYFSSIKPKDTAPAFQPEQGTANLENVRAISATDHIRGDINAPIKIVEYSDTECPFCKRFHVTMQQVMNEYGKNGKVAWVYRHSPIDSLHPKARKEAEATECANELGGNDKFWEYIDRVYEITPANNGLDPLELPKIATYVGLNVTDFNTCLDSGKYAA
ncbi:MAG: thioredoxin domain-containing protein, partial [Candidatus Paceibacterota bacterium]